MPRLKVFLSHAREDADAVRSIYDKLTDAGFAPWLDKVNLLPGQDFDREIQKAVRDSNVVVVFLSPTATTKTGYFQREIQLALDTAQFHPEGEIFLIPAILSKCDLPHRLARWHAVALFDADGFDRLCHSLTAQAIKLKLWAQVDDRIGAVDRDAKKLSKLLNDNMAVPTAGEVVTELDATAERLKATGTFDALMAFCMASRSAFAHITAAAIFGQSDDKLLDKLAKLHSATQQYLPKNSPEPRIQSYLQSIRFRTSAILAMRQQPKQQLRKKSKPTQKRGIRRR